MTTSSAGREPTAQAVARAAGDVVTAAPISFTGSAARSARRRGTARAARHRPRGRPPARSSRSSGRADAASRRCCASPAASTSPPRASSRSTAPPSRRFDAALRGRVPGAAAAAVAHASPATSRSACRAAPRAPPAARSVARLLELVGLADFAGHRPREVSGGMAQRASLARALARNPGVLLLDEPFGALDALTRLKMQDLLLDVHAAEPTTVLLVTHDVDEALQLADRVILLGRRRRRAAAPRIRQTVVVPGTARATAARPSSPSCAAACSTDSASTGTATPAASQPPRPSRTSRTDARQPTAPHRRTTAPQH